MEDSNSNPKAINWPHNIYNTVNRIVPDVDEIEDTFKYVENRVASVGGSLKKFYSGVVLDFFPLSADPTAEAESTKPEQDSASSADLVENEANSTESEEDSALELEEAKEEEEEKVNIESAFYSLMINVSEPSSTDGELTGEKSYASDNDRSVTSTSIKCSSNGFGLETSTVFDSASPRFITRSLSDVSSLCQSPFELSRLASDSVKETDNGEVVETRDLSLKSNDDSGVDRMEAISLENVDCEEEKAKLEDSCVIVDDMVLYAVSRRAQRLGSYKNKLRDFFASKKRLVKEYEQLAIWYGDVDFEPTSSSRDSQASSCDLDWEIL